MTFQGYCFIELKGHFLEEKIHLIAGAKSWGHIGHIPLLSPVPMSRGRGMVNWELQCQTVKCCIGGNPIAKHDSFKMGFCM